MAGIDSTSKTQKALAWLEASPKRKVIQAAEKFGISQPTIYKAKKRRDETISRRCPTCGNLIVSHTKTKR